MDSYFQRWNRSERSEVVDLTNDNIIDLSNDTPTSRTSTSTTDRGTHLVHSINLASTAAVGAMGNAPVTSNSTGRAGSSSGKRSSSDTTRSYNDRPSSRNSNSNSNSSSNSNGNNNSHLTARQLSSSSTGSNSSHFPSNSNSFFPGPSSSSSWRDNMHTILSHHERAGAGEVSGHADGAIDSGGSAGYYGTRGHDLAQGMGSGDRWTAHGDEEGAGAYDGDGYADMAGQGWDYSRPQKKLRIDTNGWDDEAPPGSFPRSHSSLSVHSMHSTHSTHTNRSSLNSHGSRGSTRNSSRNDIGEFFGDLFPGRVQGQEKLSSAGVANTSAAAAARKVDDGSEKREYKRIGSNRVKDKPADKPLYAPMPDLFGILHSSQAELPRNLVGPRAEEVSADAKSGILPGDAVGTAPPSLAVRSRTLAECLRAQATEAVEPFHRFMLGVRLRERVALLQRGRGDVRRAASDPPLPAIEKRFRDERHYSSVFSGYIQQEALAELDAQLEQWSSDKICPESLSIQLSRSDLDGTSSGDGERVKGGKSELRLVRAIYDSGHGASAARSLREVQDVVRQDDMVLLLPTQPMWTRASELLRILDQMNSQLAVVMDVASSTTGGSAGAAATGKPSAGKTVIVELKLLGRRSGVPKGSEQEAGSQRLGEQVVCTILPLMSFFTVCREFVAVHGISNWTCCPLAPYLLSGVPTVSIELLEGVAKEVKSCVASIIQHNANRQAMRPLLEQGTASAAQLQTDTLTRHRVHATQTALTCHLRVLQTMAVDGSVLKRSGVGRQVAAVAGRDSSKAPLYPPPEEGRACYYMDPESTDTMKALASGLVEQWTEKIKRDHRRSTLSALSGGNALASPQSGISEGAAPHGIAGALWKTLCAQYNPSQLMAIQYVLRRCALTDSAEDSASGGVGSVEPGASGGRNPTISLLQGPPGTGKTRTIIALVAVLLGRREVTSATTAPQPLLVCAPSNAAVDELCKRLAVGVLGSNGKLRSLRIVRLGKSEAASASVTAGRGSGGGGSDDAACIVGLCLETQTEIRLAIHPAFLALQTTKRELDQVSRDLDKTVGGASKSSKAGTGAGTGSRVIREEGLDRRHRDIVSRLKYLRLTRDNQERAVELQRLVIRRDLLLTADVIVSTLATAGGRVLLDHVLNAGSTWVDSAVPASVAPISTPASDTGTSSATPWSGQVLFETVIIDEAGQCTEPSALIPLRYGCKALVLIGDPRQLPATVKSHHPDSQRHYGRSLFERLEESGHEKIMLRTQYRMHPEIRRFPSEQFYEGKLVDADSIVREVAEVEASGGSGQLSSSSTVAPCLEARWGIPAVCIFDTSSLTPRQSSGSLGAYNSSAPEHRAGTSYTNPGEAGIVLALLQQWEGLPRFLTIGVLSPYKAQVEEIRRGLGQAMRGNRISRELFEQVEVNTIDGFQGREKDVVLLSTVRSRSFGGGYRGGGGWGHSNIGFLDNERRLNVAVTRAKRHCIIVGNLCTLGGVDRSVSSDESTAAVWSRLIASLISRNLVYDSAAVGAQSKSNPVVPRPRSYLDELTRCMTVRPRDRGRDHQNYRQCGSRTEPGEVRDTPHSSSSSSSNR